VDSSPPEDQIRALPQKKRTALVARWAERALGALVDAKITRDPLYVKDCSLLIESAWQLLTKHTPLRLFDGTVVDEDAEAIRASMAARVLPGNAVAESVVRAAAGAAQSARAAEPELAVAACKEAWKAVESLKDDETLTGMRVDFEKIRKEKNQGRITRRYFRPLLIASSGADRPEGPRGETH
jgi:hypothetical protein